VAIISVSSPSLVSPLFPMSRQMAAVASSGKSFRLTCGRVSAGGSWSAVGRMRVVGKAVGTVLARSLVPGLLVD